MSGIVRSAWNMQDRYDASCKSARFHPQTSDGSAYQGDNEYHAGLRSSFLIPSHFRTVYTRFVLNDIVLYSHPNINSLNFQIIKWCHADIQTSRKTASVRQAYRTRRNGACRPPHPYISKPAIPLLRGPVCLYYGLLMLHNKANGNDAVVQAVAIFAHCRMVKS